MTISKRHTIFILIILVLIIRYSIISWGLPYKDNPTHKYGLFFDSHGAIHDQILVLKAISTFPNNFLNITKRAYTPLFQRYLSAPPIAIILFIKSNFHKYSWVIYTVIVKVLLS